MSLLENTTGVVGTARIGDVARAAITYHAPLHIELANQLETYAASQNVKPETIIAEAVRAYLGVDA